MSAIDFFTDPVTGAAIDNGGNFSAAERTKPVMLADAVAERYQGPLDILHKFHSDAAAAAASVGVLMPDVIEFTGTWVYAANLDGKLNKEQGYLAEIRERKKDDLIRPVITFRTFRSGGDAVQWNPDNLLWDEHNDNSATHQAHDPEKYKAQAAQLAKEHAAKRAIREKQDAIGRAVVAMTAANLIDRLQDCTEHEYLTRKGIDSHGAKIATAKLTGTLYNQAESTIFTGTICEAGELIIPLYCAGGIINVQRIKPSGDKKFLSGGGTSGAHYLIKGTEQGQAFVAEGFATAATVSEATGRDVYVAFSAHNLKAVSDAHLSIGAVAADGNEAGVAGAEKTGLPFHTPPANGVGDDWNDYAQARTIAGVKMQLEGVKMADREVEPEKDNQHPLTKFISLSNRPEPPRMVIPDLIAEGVVVFAGGHGVGKTTVMLPLAMAAAGVHDKDYELAPKHWRHVIYITEDVYQAQRIITGYGEHLDFNNRDIFKNIEERVHIVEAQRMKADFLVLAGKYYREKYSRTVVTTGADGKQYITELLPLIVIDTMAATIELENENDNSEASKAIAAIKQDFEGLPTWIIGHVAKANLGRSDAVTLRGAGAFEADANQVLYIVQDDKDGSRWLIRGKTRFESPWQELEIKSDKRIITVLNCFGDYEEIVLRWSVAYPPDSSRAERAKQAKEDRAQQEADQLRSTIITNVMQRYQAGVPLNKTELRAIVRGNSKATSDAVTALLADGWLYEVEVPKGERVPNKPRFLVALDETERAEYQETGIVPPAKQWIPPSWKRQVDDTETEQDEDYQF